MMKKLIEKMLGKVKKEQPKRYAMVWCSIYSIKLEVTKEACGYFGHGYDACLFFRKNGIVDGSVYARKWMPISGWSKEELEEMYPEAVDRHLK